MHRVNEYDQPVGPALPDWVPPAVPDAVTIYGRYCLLERLDPQRHAAALFAAYAQAPDDRDWTYMSAGPFATEDDYANWTTAAANRDTERHYAIIDRATLRPLGTMALMRMTPQHGCLEVGTLMLSPAVQRTRIATEAHYMLMRYVFELGYRRYEWKCDSLNQASIRAARRLGFTYEGTFRQAMVYKHRSRDTAWFAIIDQDWPAIQRAFEQWLVPENFDPDGNQITRLRTQPTTL